MKLKDWAIISGIGASMVALACVFARAIRPCQNPDDPDTWPAVPEDWDWNPDTPAWINYYGYTVPHYDFVLWKYGLTQAEYDYLRFLYNVDIGDTAGYEGAWGEAYTPTCLMPDRFCHPYYPDWYSGWRALYTQFLTAEQIRRVEATPLRTIPEADELENVILDEIAMMRACHGCVPYSNYYKERWYIYFRYVSAGPANPEGPLPYMDNPCPM